MRIALAEFQEGLARKPSFMAQPGDVHRNAAADLNCDGEINIFDQQILAWNIGNEYGV